MIRNLVKIRFPNLLRKRVNPQRYSVMWYSVQATSHKAMTVKDYLSVALVNFVYVAHAQAQTTENDNGIKQRILTAVKEADELFKMGKFQESYNILQAFKEMDEIEVIWRLARDMFNLSKVKGTPKDKARNYIMGAYAQITRAIKLTDSHYAVHKWMAILYDAKSALDGPKARMAALPVFKEHLSKAIELNPKDATSIYMLGQYYYSLADLSWFQKTIATTLFGTPPEGSYEEAFHYFSKAEDVEPNFYSANLLMLGKTCLKLQKLEAAYFWLKCASAYPVRTDEDEAVRLEAESLLKDHALNRNLIRTEHPETDREAEIPHDNRNPYAE